MICSLRRELLAKKRNSLLVLLICHPAEPDIVSLRFSLGRFQIAMREEAEMWTRAFELALPGWEKIKG